MKCEKCNKEILKESKFCPYCGKVVIFKSKEDIKQKLILPAHYVYAISILVIGLAYIGTTTYFKFQENKLKQQEARQKIEAQNTAEKQKTDNKRSLNSCLLIADIDYSEFWNSECKNLGRGDDCVLPQYNADRVEQVKQNDKTECFKKYPQN